MLTFENKAFRDIAANAPYDVVEILTNSATYGGGGIFGLYSTVAADSVWAPYIFVHEFGHHIAGLADEYYTSDVAYLPAGRSRRAVGAERDGAARSGGAEVEGSRRRRARRCRRRGRKRSSSAIRRRSSRSAAQIRAANRPEAEMDALFREEMTHDTALLERGPARRQGRRVRRRELRGARLLPAAGRLHHVHARQRAVLRGLPPRHRGDSRPVCPLTTPP